MLPNNFNGIFETEFKSDETSHGHEVNSLIVYRKRFEACESACVTIMENNPKELPFYIIQNFYSCCDEAAGKVYAGGYALYLENYEKDIKKIERLKKRIMGLKTDVEEILSYK